MTSTAVTSARVGYFIDTDGVGGAEVLYMELAAAALRSGLTPVGIHFGNRAIERFLAERGIASCVAPDHGSYKSTGTLLRFGRSFGAMLRASGVELLHSHLFGPICGGALGARFAKIPHVGTLHDLYIVEERPSRIRLLQAAALLGTRLVCISEQMRGFYRGRAWFPRGSMSVVPNGAPLPVVRRSRHEIRAELGLPDDSLVAVCVARLVPLKRHDVLLRAIAAALEDVPSLRLLVVGEGDELPFLELLAVELGIRSRVTFTGHREDVTDLLAASDMFVLLSDSEGLSRSILEAMFHGMPVLTTDVGGSRELLEDGAAGILVPAGDVASAVRELVRLGVDGALRRRFGERAKGRANGSYSFTAMLDGYFTLYRMLLGRADLRPPSAPQP